VRNGWRVSALWLGLSPSEEEDGMDATEVKRCFGGEDAECQGERVNSWHGC